MEREAQAEQSAQTPNLLLGNILYKKGSEEIHEYLGGQKTQTKKL